jgi:FkbM family methyltransferase
MKWFFLFYERYGLLTAIVLLLKFKFKSFDAISVPDLKFPVRLRAGTTDSAAFIHVFLYNDYALPFQKEPKYILDAGANIGLTSVYWANQFPNATIISLEPEIGNYNALLKNTEQYPNIKPMHVALWNKDTFIKIIDSGMGEWAFTVEETHNSNDIPAVCIESLCKKQGIPGFDIVKIDIEGSEKEVFENAESQWYLKTDVVVVETHDRYKKGTSKAVFNAFIQSDHNCMPKGDNLIFYKNSVINDQGI